MKINKEFIKDLKTWKFEHNELVNNIYIDAVMKFLEEYKPSVRLRGKGSQVFVNIHSESSELFCPDMYSMGAEKIFKESMDIAFYAEDMEELEAFKMFFERKSQEISKMIKKLKKDIDNDYD